LIHHGRIGRENLGFASLKRARELGIPFILTPFHHPRWVGWRYRSWLALYREADHLCALTESERGMLEALGVRSDRISVIGHGPSVLPASQADPSTFRKNHGLGSYPTVLFLGQQYAYKGFMQLYEAATQVWKQIPDARFVFVGPRTSESTAYFHKRISPRILELGPVSLEEKCSALAACDVFCMPSTQESFGGVYVEAWMYSKPVIGGRIAAISSVIDEGTNGLLVRQDPAEIAAAILDLLGNRDKARAFGQAGHAKAIRDYTWEAITARVRELYARIISENRPAAD
jgi:glycosyltransferase involved in cell wall biosynthesis